MSHYYHLTISERESICESIIKGKTVRQIARETGRSASTISRELKSNRCAQSYRKSEAQESYQKRRKRCRWRLILAKGKLRDTVVRLISCEQWSPEQISMRLELARGASVVSYATIYRALSRVYMEPKGRECERAKVTTLFKNTCAVRANKVKARRQNRKLTSIKR